MPRFMLLQGDGTEVIFIIAAVMLAVQLLLCLKVKRVWIRLIPTVLSVLATVGLIVMMTQSDGWDVLGYLLLVICSFALVGACAVAWIIWAIIRIINAIRSKSRTDIDKE